MPDKLSLGGPAACEPAFVSELRRRGLEVDEETYVYGEKLGRTTTAERIVRVLRVAQKLRRRILSAQHDVVHLNSSFDARALLRDLATLRVVSGTGATIFLKFHGSDADLFQARNAALRRVVRSVLKRADGIGLLSSEERENFLRGGVDPGKIFVVKNVVEIDGSLESATNISNETPQLLFISRFIAAKGLLDVIRAAAVVRDRGHRFRLACVGDGPARKEAQDEVRRLDLGSFVEFPGYVGESEAQRFYSASTMLVFPTYHYEGFPMVIFKSLAHGLPIITTRIRAAADYLREPDNCLWVEPKNPSMLAEKIAYLLQNSDVRFQMGENNRRLAGKFDAATVTND